MEALRRVDQDVWGWGEAKPTFFSVDAPQRAENAARSPSDPSGGVKPWERQLAKQETGVIYIRHQPVHVEHVIDEVAEDRLTLLSKKYANSQHVLSREDDARLRILDEELVIETPRYTEEDWAVLAEARELIQELRQG